MRSVAVVYDDGMVDKVDTLRLRILIEEKMIVKFQRGKSWAYIGVDPIRKSRRNNYSGPEHRRQN